ncbi:S8 family serine peptidase [Chelativorans sp. YIM 93263]|uniref:S8 family serine peptidase n=1 Tax=Chelativorans sp. YIM 93263 TaxID=2906648 RepID=UPI00237929D1|nr:S8 family serine peptidase [Chelativorans sp. YIM 93263]
MGKLFFERLRKAPTFLLLLSVLGSFALPDPGPFQIITPVLADDDDDDGDDDHDDDDDDDDNDRGRGSRGYDGSSSSPVYRAARPPRFLRELIRPFRNRPAAPPRRAAPPPPPEPRYAEHQIVAMGLSDEHLAQLEADDYVVLQQSELSLIGQSIVKLEVPSGTDLETAREDVRVLDPTSQADFNHYYRPEQADVQARICPDGLCWAPLLIKWPVRDAGARQACDTAVRIGMIDTGINPEHKTFAESAIDVMRIADEEEPASGRQHGTAVAALLVGSQASRSPGLLSDAKLFAVDAFQRASSGRDRAEVFDLVVGIDHLLAHDVSIINMSLAGDANDLLRDSIESAVAENKVIFVAAVGNDGPRAEPVYPAAYPEVIAVTAVDRHKRPYRRAVQGEHVDLASPGVDVWTAASISGARPKTGTSFATPFVSAAAAVVKAEEPALSPEEVEQRLASMAEDLGEPGKDPVFGWGLLNASKVCGLVDENKPIVMD